MRKFWGGVKPFYRCLSKLVESEKSDFTNINTLQKWKIGLQRIKIKSWDLFEKNCDDQNKNRRLDPGTGDGDQGTDPTWVFKTELMSLAMAIGREWGRSIRQWELLDFGWISGWVLWTFTKTERGKVLEDKLMNAFRSYMSETLIIRCLLSINMWISSPQMNSLNEDFFPQFLNVPHTYKSLINPLFEFCFLFPHKSYRFCIPCCWLSVFSWPISNNHPKL